MRAKHKSLGFLIGNGKMIILIEFILNTIIFIFVLSVIAMIILISPILFVIGIVLAVFVCIWMIIVLMK